MQEPHDLYSQLMERENRHAAPTHASHQSKQTWNTLPVGLPVNPQLDLATASNHSTGLLYSTSSRRLVLVLKLPTWKKPTVIISTELC